MFVGAPASMWLGRMLSEYSYIRVSPGGSLGMDILRHILVQYNAENPAGRLFRNLLDFVPDMSQAVLVNGTVIPGNDFIAVVSGCNVERFSQPISFNAPLDRILGAGFAQVRGLPPSKRITLTKVAVGGGYRSGQRKRGAELPAESAAQRSRLA